MLPGYKLLWIFLIYLITLEWIKLFLLQMKPFDVIGDSDCEHS